MTSYTSDFLTVLSERGFIHQCSDPQGLDEAARSGTLTAYIGFDCTAPSLHVGSLVQIMMLRWLQKTGHKPIVLMGGGTTRIGDPTGRDESRQFLTDEQIAVNMAGIQKVFSRFLAFGDGRGEAMMVNNADWLDGIDYIGFLRDYGRHFTINRMLTFDSVKLRLEREQPLTLLEFNYMILQAYDYVELYRRHGCILQMGGSDQWGNIVNGIELGRRVAGVHLHGLTTPLLTTASGAKMGKTAAGAVWLNSDMLAPYDYWQFWRNAEDDDVGRFLRLFTELPLDEVVRLEALAGQEINEAKKLLANEATALLHGREAAGKAADTARETFEEGASSAGLPSLAVERAALDKGIGILSLTVMAGLAASNGEARRAVAGGAIRVNDQPVADPALSVSSAMLGPDGVVKLSFGKKRHMLVRPE